MIKLRYSYIITFLCSLCCSCSRGNVLEVIEKEAEEKNYLSIFVDSNYARGFKVGSTIEGNDRTHGYLDYNATTEGKPVWLIAQWNCLNNDILKAAYTTHGNKHSYRTEGGNCVEVDTKKGSIVLGINTTSEYGLNGITSNPRALYEPWPTLLLEYKLSADKVVSVADKEEIRMFVDYKILEVEDRMEASKVDTNLHSAQFQWFITVQNRNINSTDFGKYLWFGLNLYDKRYEYAPFYAAQDGGKEQNTGAFIYMPDMRDIMGKQGKTEVGKKMHIDVDVLPIIKEAFSLAQKRNYLQNTTWKELYIGASNIGWEVPGTYNVSVQIDALNIKYR